MRFVLIVLLVAVCGCPSAPPVRTELSVAPLCSAGGDDFQPAVKAALDRFVASVDPASKPVAVFDWDNTVIKNDVGAATLFHMVRQGLVRRPARWEDFADLTDGARARLAAACDGDGGFLPSREEALCGEMLAALYKKGTLPGDAAPFREHDHRTYRPTTAWQAQLQAGYTPAEVRRLAREVISRMCAAPVGTTARAGGMDVEGYIRLHRAMVQLMEQLRRRGFEIWIASASPQNVVEAFASELGIPADHVIGIRSVLDAGGRITHGLQGCGRVKDGENRMLTYIEGKRCWIKKVIGRRAALVAGDATTDISMLRDATGLRLVIDRGYPELMCYALNGERAGQGWAVNPMLYEAAPARKRALPCSTTACVNGAGKAVPCTTAEGGVLADIN